MKTRLYTLLAIPMLASMAQAQISWTSATGGNWDNNANWSASYPNAAGADARITNFTAAGSYIINASSAQTNTIGRLDFGTNSSANAVTNILAANAGLKFQTTSGNAELNLRTAGSGSVLSISSPITLATNLSVSLLRNGSTFIVPTFSGAIDLGSYEFRFGVSRQADINMFSTISGTGKLVFNGPGSDRQVIFTNTNSAFSGGVDLDASGNILRLGNNAAFTGSATNGLLGTGTIRFNSTVDSFSSPRSPTLRADGVFLSGVEDNSNNVLPNSIVISNGRFGIIETTDALNTTGDISGSGKLYKIGGAASGIRPWAVNNANTNFSGTVELRGGQIFARTNDAFGTNATLVFAPTNSADRIGLGGATTNTGSPVVRLASTLVFSNTGNNTFIQTAGGSSLELAGNFSNAGAGTAGAIIFSRGANTDQTGFAYGSGGGNANFILAGTGSLSNSIGLTNGGGAVSTLILSNTSGTQTFSGVIYGDGTLNRSGTGGTTELTGSNSFAGTTTVSAGTLKLDAAAGSALAGTTNVTVSGGILLISRSNQINDTATVTLSGGTIAKGSGSMDETMGALTLAADSTIDFGSGTGSFTFATYTPDSFKLKFDNFNLGNSLTVTTGTFNTNNFNFNGFGYSFDNVPSGGFTITAVPEPSTVLAAIGLTGLLLWGSRRRDRRSATQKA